MSAISSSRQANCQTCRTKLICPRCSTRGLERYEIKQLKWDVACTFATVAIFLALLSGLFFINSHGTSPVGQPLHTHTFTSCLSPKDCYATGKGLKVAVIRKRNTAVLYIVDHRGNTYTREVKTIACEVINESTGEILECMVNKTTGNKYKVSYRATSRGRHQLHIKVEGEHIKGSPFPVTVKLPLQKLGTPVKTISGVKKPCGVSVTQRGEIIVAENDGHCISILSPTGEKLQSFGSQGSGLGQFYGPRGVAVDDGGNILVVNEYNNRIQRFTSKGQFIKAVGKYGNRALEFDSPMGIAIHPLNKKVYVPDRSNHRIQILNPDLTFSSSFGSQGSGDGQFQYPWDVAFDSTGNVYVVDSSNHCIQVFTADGKFLRKFGKEGSGVLSFPSSISIDSEDVVYVTEWNNHRVSVFTSEGKFLTSFGKQGSGPGQFYHPRGIAVDKNGVVYVSDTSNNRLQLF